MPEGNAAREGFGETRPGTDRAAEDRHHPPVRRTTTPGADTADAQS